jgi:hypothetical protein
MSTLEMSSTASCSTTSVSNHAASLFRIVTGFLLMALLWKLPGFLFFYRVYFETPIIDEFFPSVFRSNATLGCAYILPILLGGAVFRSKKLWVLRSYAFLALVSLSVLCVHQGSYNDVSFMTAWWTSLWLCWLATAAACADDRLLHQRGARLALAILAMILLGGGVGKWSAEYWSGSVLYEIYFVDRDFWVFNLLRSWFDNDGLMTIAKWYSRMVIVLETACFAALWWLPRRWAGALAIVVFTSIACFSNWYLFSVLLSPIGLATIALLPLPGDAADHGVESFGENKRLMDIPPVKFQTCSNP